MSMFNWGLNHVKIAKKKSFFLFFFRTTLITVNKQKKKCTFNCLNQFCYHTIVKTTKLLKPFMLLLYRFISICPNANFQTIIIPSALTYVYYLFITLSTYLYVNFFFPCLYVFASLHLNLYTLLIVQMEYLQYTAFFQQIKSL